jgi:hypothetical protein
MTFGNTAGYNLFSPPKPHMGSTNYPYNRLNPSWLLSQVFSCDEIPRVKSPLLLAIELKGVAFKICAAPR